MTRRFVTWFILACSLAALYGCGGGSANVRNVTEDFFFPARPDVPRIQFLRSFNSSADIQPRQALLDYLAGVEDPSEYTIRKPFSVASWKGRLYVTDSFGIQGVNVFDLAQSRFYVLGQTPGPGELKKPINVFVDDEGFKYVSDLLKRQVLVYGPDDVFVRSYGDGSSFLPVACVTDGNEIFILDIAKDRVKSDATAGEWDEVRRDQILVLDRRSGRPLRRIGQHGSDRQGFSFATFLAIDRLGHIYVVDSQNHRVVKMDREGRVLTAFGRHGDRAGDFAHMKGVAVDRSGLIYVVDAAFQAVQAFDNAGLPLFAMGGPRAPQGPMDLPAGIWIDYHNVDYFKKYYADDFVPEYVIYVANQLSPRHRIGVYAYGRRKGIDYPSEDEIATLDNQGDGAPWQMPVFPPEGPSGTLPTRQRADGQ